MVGTNWLARKLQLWNGLLVLNYHRIGEPGGSLFDPGLWSASADEFDWQLKFLKSNFDVIGPSELNAALNDRAARCVLITFDDGYRDNFDVAFPILKSHGLTATWFITSGFIDDKFLAWWDEISWMVRTTDQKSCDLPNWLRESVDLTNSSVALKRLLYVYKRLTFADTQTFLNDLGTAAQTGRAPCETAADLWMTWDMLREMLAAGMTIGGHSVTHPILSSLDTQQQHEEISTCRQRLEEQLNVPIETFSYPVGRQFAVNSEVISSVKQAGFRFAFSHYGGYWNHDNQGFFDIPRVPVERFMNHNAFKSIVSLPQFFSKTA